MADIQNLEQLFEGFRVNAGWFTFFLAFMIVCDFVTGILKAYKTSGKISSSKLRDGGFKKAGIVFTVMLAYSLSKLFNDGSRVIFHGVEAYYIYTELISILENLQALGIKMPSVFKKILGDEQDGNK